MWRAGIAALSFVVACPRTAALEFQNESARAPAVLIVTGLWGIPNKRTEDPREALRIYDEWMEHTVKMAAPFYVYGDELGLETVRKHRGAWDEKMGTATVYKPLALTEFRTHRMLESAGIKATPRGRWVWAEKVELVRKAAEDTGKSYEWLAWMDVGINQYRESDPPTHAWPVATNWLDKFPHRQVIASVVGQLPQWGSCQLLKEKTCVWSDLCIAGTAWLSHRDFLADFAEIYYEELRRCIQAQAYRVCLDDQGIHSKLLLRDLYYVPGIELPPDESGYSSTGEGEGWAQWLVSMYQPDLALGADAEAYFSKHKIYGERLKSLSVPGTCDEVTTKRMMRRAVRSVMRLVTRTERRSMNYAEFDDDRCCG